MKKIATLTLLGAALLAPGLLRAQDAPPKMKIAVLTFTEKSGSRIGTATEDWFIDELVNTKRFRVMERAQLTNILNEQSFQLSGAVDQNSAVKAGKMLGVPVVIFGNIDFAEKQSSGGGYIPGGGRFGGISGGGSKRTSEGNLTCRAISVQTGEIIYSKQETISDSSMNITVMGIGGGSDWDETKARKVFQPAITKIVADMVKKFDELKDSLGGDPEGTVVMVKEGEGRLIVKLGTEEGVKVGDTYTIVRADIIRDDNGNELGRDEKKIGEAVIEKIMGAHASAARITSGKGFKKDDILKKKK